MPCLGNRYAVAMAWRSILANHPVQGSITVPGSKSISNRALLLAALSDGPSEITGLLLARDTELMIAALQQLGCQIAVGQTVKVMPKPITAGGEINVGLAGTVMRFVPIIAALAKGDTKFYGDQQAMLRPMQITIESLRQLGIQVTDESRGTLPFVVHGTGEVSGGEINIDVSASSQFLSALLLVGSKFQSGVKVVNTGNSVPSLPHIQMTIDILREHGVIVEQFENVWQVAPGQLRAIDRVIEPDLSNASVFLAAAMATAGQVKINHWPTNSTQPSKQIQDVLLKLGGNIELDQTGLTLTGPVELNPIQVDLSEIGELTPTIAALTALAPGKSTLTGISHLRGHETDRLKAISVELAKLGIKAVELADGLEIYGGNILTPVEMLTSYHDHRMATFAAILGLKVQLELDDIATTAKTMPNFVTDWAELIGAE